MDAYLDELSRATGHADRAVPMRLYCTGLLLPGERKSVEPMAARLAPENVRRMHQSLHHVVSTAAWSDEMLLHRVRDAVLPAMTRQDPVVAWIIDDTGLPKKGRHSVGVTRQYCGQTGKQDNCQVAVSLSVATWEASLPIAWRLYLPDIWASDAERRRKAGVPEEIGFRTKLEIALDQIRQAVQDGVAQGPILADPAYGNDTGFREELTGMELDYVVGVQSTTTVWPPGAAPLPPPPWKGGRGRPAHRLRRDAEHAPVSAKQLALSLPAKAWRTVTWREGAQRPLRSRFAAVRVRAAHRDHKLHQPRAEEWLLIEWPRDEAAPRKYWLSNLPASIPLRQLVALAKQRWIIERDYQELKQELGLGHFEGRGWRGFHHHATLAIAAYGFLVAERSRFSPSARAGYLGLPAPELPPGFQPRGAHPSRTA
ncbi:MAG TPA: IS701 family transposase [Acidobacteriaceae bacterium]|nr:IS701 family transposase [Acidobacteriaceae bacterium]